MSRKYKFHEPNSIYFISSATVNWIDVFTRKVYLDIIVDCLNYCNKNKGMEVFAWCIMPNHIHLIFRSNLSKPADLIRDFKSYSSRVLLKEIINNNCESRREWILNLFSEAANGKNNGSKYQLWQHNNHPIELYSDAVIIQKTDYIHDNPVVAGFVNEPQHWTYSSAIDYFDDEEKGLVELAELV